MHHAAFVQGGPDAGEVGFNPSPRTRVLIVEEQKPFASVGTQLAYMIQREAFDELDGPIHRLATIDAPAIYSPPVEVEQLPNPGRVVKAVLAALA